VITVRQLLLLAHQILAEAAPDGLKKNSILRHLGQLLAELGTYGELCMQRPEMSEEGRAALARARRLDKLWIRKDCGCK
jgi:hypothetical protein